MRARVDPGPRLKPLLPSGRATLEKARFSAAMTSSRARALVLASLIREPCTTACIPKCRAAAVPSKETERIAKATST